jgi:hypothetical protein
MRGGEKGERVVLMESRTKPQQASRRLNRIYVFLMRELPLFFLCGFMTMLEMREIFFLRGERSLEGGGLIKRREENGVFSFFVTTAWGGERMIILLCLQEEKKIDFAQSVSWPACYLPACLPACLFACAA